MNQRQLAHVLIKILGLYICVECVQRIISTAVSAIQILSDPKRSRGSLWAYPATTLAVTVVSLVIGACLIAGSWWLAGRLFRTERA